MVLLQGRRFNSLVAMGVEVSVVAAVAWLCCCAGQETDICHRQPLFVDGFLDVVCFDDGHARLDFTQHLTLDSKWFCSLIVPCFLLYNLMYQQEVYLI